MRSLQNPHTPHTPAACAARLSIVQVPANRCNCGASIVASVQAHFFCAADASCSSVQDCLPASTMILHPVFRVRPSFHRLVNFMGGCRACRDTKSSFGTVDSFGSLVFVWQNFSQIVFFGLSPMSKFVVQFGCESGGIFCRQRVRRSRSVA